MTGQTRMREKTRAAGIPTPKKVEETEEHGRLKDVLMAILKSSEFRCDRDVSLNFSGQKNDSGQLLEERSIDVVAFGHRAGRRFLLIFECKSGGKVSDLNQKMSSWDADIARMREGKAQIVSSGENTITETDFKADSIKVCIVFGKNTKRERFDNLELTLRGRGFFAWDDLALSYYKKTSETVGKTLKYHIMKEFGVTLEPTGTQTVDAIQIRQGDLEMFVFGAKPSTLLRIGYVSRRASGRPEGYQRILNKDRISKISQFLSSRGALLPNAIIIAFDNDPAIQEMIKFERGKLSLPRAYCCAWIIDGQHRVYGFLNTPYAEMDEDDPEEVFMLPVVAFRRLDPIMQNSTFVSINLHQKKIDPALLCDLSTALRNWESELTWPSLLVKELNDCPPLKNRVKIRELDEGRPISITSFARYGLLEGLLGYDPRTRSYNGRLYAYSPFNTKEPVDSEANKRVFKQQLEVLTRFFDAVATNTNEIDPEKDPWHNAKQYSLVRPTGVNALLLVLSRIMLKYPKLEDDMHKNFETYLRPLRKVNFRRAYVVKQGGGWKGFRKMANVVLRKLNKENRDKLRLFGKKDKK